MKAKTLTQQALEFIEKIKTLQIPVKHNAKSFSPAPGVTVTQLDAASLKGVPVVACSDCGKPMKLKYAAAIMVGRRLPEPRCARAERSFAE